jgi:hypothetical protein
MISDKKTKKKKQVWGKLPGILSDAYNKV